VPLSAGGIGPGWLNSTRVCQKAVDVTHEAEDANKLSVVRVLEQPIVQDTPNVDFNISLILPFESELGPINEQPKYAPATRWSRHSCFVKLALLT